MTRGSAQRVIPAAEQRVLARPARKRLAEWLERADRRPYRISTQNGLHFIWRGAAFVGITVTMRGAMRKVERDARDQIGGYAA